MSETYLDANASAPLRPEAREAILAALDLGAGNASSPHASGRRVRRLIGDARDAVAALVGAQASEIVFTSGATEANALGVLGLLDGRKGALVTTRAEHASLARLADREEARGREVRRAGVDRHGRWDADEVVRLADGAAALATLVAEPVTGALEPVAGLAGRLGDTALHLDAAQALGRVPTDFAALGATTMAVSAHKLGGPQGIGALVVRTGAPWRNPVADATHERGRRAGTEAAALIAGFGAAATAVRATGEDEARRAGSLVTALAAEVGAIPGATLVTRAGVSLPNTLLVAFDDCPGDLLMAALDAAGLRVSTGSACASGARVPPEVLLAGGRATDEAARAVRISVAWDASATTLRGAADVIASAVLRVRAARATS